MRSSTHQSTAQFLIPPDSQVSLGTDRGGVLTLYLAAVFDWILEEFSAIQGVNHTSSFSA